MDKTLIVVMTAAALAGCDRSPELVALADWQVCTVPLSADQRCPADKVTRKPEVVRVVDFMVSNKLIKVQPK